MTNYDELVQKLRDWSDTHSFSAVPRAAADAITQLRAERDYAMEMVNAQDNQIDALRALLKEIREQGYRKEMTARIDAALAKGE